MRYRVRSPPPRVNLVACGADQKVGPAQILRDAVSFEHDHVVLEGEPNWTSPRCFSGDASRSSRSDLARPCDPVRRPERLRRTHSDRSREPRNPAPVPRVQPAAPVDPARHSTMSRTRSSRSCSTPRYRGAATRPNSEADDDCHIAYPRVKDDGGGRRRLGSSSIRSEVAVIAVS